MKITESKFSSSLTNYKDNFNLDLPEIAFAGKSNVGKSSLINVLLNRKRLSYVSKKPGKTQALNFFLINKKFYFVDFPGYGFSKVSFKLKDDWKKLIEQYLTNSKKLKILFILIDVRRGLSEQDLELVNFCIHYEINFCLVLTKADKLSKNKQRQTLSTLAKKSGINFPFPSILFSAKTKFGKNEILKIIETFLN